MLNVDAKNIDAKGYLRKGEL
jgi:hypothetical protein